MVIEMSEASWLAATRRNAMDRFQSLGFPTARDEEWRFTSVAPIAQRTFAPRPGTPADATGLDLSPYLYRGFGPTLVFLNGSFAPALSDAGAPSRGVVVGSLTSLLPDAAGDLEAHLAKIAPFDRQPFTALNTASFADGAFIRVAARTVVDAPVHILFVSTDAASAGEPSTVSHPRVLVVMGAESQASIVESYAGPSGGRYFTNAVTEIALGENAVLDHYKLQRESAGSSHVASMHVRAERNAKFTSHSISLGGALVRNDAVAVLDGEGVDCTLNGLYVADGERLVDNHTTIDHAQPHCGSREVYKGILADRARGVFNGKIVVRPDAQKTDAKQTNRALLLSEDAQINTKPQLEIFANDVKCTHGAAVGQLDDEAVFYLRSRGLGETEARHMLIHAFVGDVLAHIPIEPVRTGIEEVLRAQLARALPAA